MVIFFESYETCRRRLFRNSSSSFSSIRSGNPAIFLSIFWLFDCKSHIRNLSSVVVCSWLSVLVVFALGPVFAHLVSISTGSNFKSIVWVALFWLRACCGFGCCVLLLRFDSQFGVSAVGFCRLFSVALCALL
ncbi:hypothetical protein QYF36_024272 [Acer negundo]|nr:hypothetical protein QYF36_024272 [Acer negundo]